MIPTKTWFMIHAKIFRPWLSVRDDALLQQFPLYKICDNYLEKKKALIMDPDSAAM